MYHWKLRGINLSLPESPASEYCLKHLVPNQPQPQVVPQPTEPTSFVPHHTGKKCKVIEYFRECRILYTLVFLLERRFRSLQRKNWNATQMLPLKKLNN